VTKATINANIIRNFPSDSGIMFQCGNATSDGSPSSTCGSSVANVIAITNNDIAGQSAANRIGTQGILADVNGVGTGRFNISGNEITNVVGNAISHNIFGDATVTSVIDGNTVVKGDTANSTANSGIVGGVGETSGFASNTPTLNVTLSNNNLSGHDGNGILFVARENTGTVNITVVSNTVAEPLGGNRPGIRIDAGNFNPGGDPPDTVTICADIRTNTTFGSSTSPGIGVRKEPTAPGTVFGIEGLSGTSDALTVETFLSTQNPNSELGTGFDGGTRRAIVLNGTNFVNCSAAP
jgi:hypothetical protein